MATKDPDNVIRHRSKVSVHHYSPLSDNKFQDNDVLKKRTNYLLPESIFILLAIFFSVIYVTVYICDRFLPSRPFDYQRKVGEFNEIRAFNYMSELSSIGPRPTGSYQNEVLAVDYLKRQISLIKDIALDSYHDIQVEIQKSNGSFSFNFMDGMTSCYQNIKNIIVKIGPYEKKTKKAILINCHFDSVPTSPGASDDAINCAIMLELLRVFSQQPKPLQHDIIFLFNGAEENVLQGSHGFITQHRWASQISAFINLEACGAGGREMLFQADKAHSWLLTAYARGAPYPFGSIMAQEIFQSGLVPSDTDFRIFRDFGHLPGLDFAFASNGYVYHTRFDAEKFVTAGSLLRAGENLLGLIRELQKSPYVEAPESFGGEQYMYLDFLGIFMVIFSISFGRVLAVASVLVSLISIVLNARKRTSHQRWSLTWELAYLGGTFILLLFSLVVACLTCILVALGVTSLGAPMAWFSKPYLILGLYLAPSLMALLAWHRIIASFSKVGEEWQAESRFYDAARLFFILLTCVPLLGYPITSTYIFSFFLLFPTFIRALGTWLWAPLFPKSQTAWKGLHLCFIVVLMQVVPALLGVYTSMLIFHAFVPIMGRVGPWLNSDLVIGALTAILTFINTLYSMSLLHVVKQASRTLLTLFIVFLVTFVAIVVTPLGFPFSSDADGPAPQRYFFVHVSRTMYNSTGGIELEDSGFWTATVDYVGIRHLAPHLPGLTEAHQVNCSQYMYCGMAYYLPVSTKLRQSYYLPAEKPQVHTPVKLVLESRETINSSLQRLTFKAIGSTHISMVFCPRSGVFLKRWSLGNGWPYPGVPVWEGRPTYFVYLSQAEIGVPWKFWLDFELSSTLTNKDSLVEVIFISHFIHGPDQITGNFTKLLHSLPSWTHIIPWTAIYERHIY